MNGRKGTFADVSQLVGIGILREKKVDIHLNLICMDRARLYNYFLVPERCAQQSHRLKYTYKIKQKLSKIMITISMHTF